LWVVVVWCVVVVVVEDVVVVVLLVVVVLVVVVFGFAALCFAVAFFFFAGSCTAVEVVSVVVELTDATLAVLLGRVELEPQAARPSAAAAAARVTAPARIFTYSRLTVAPVRKLRGPPGRNLSERALTSATCPSHLKNTSA
jgi:hypothetical protein